LSCAGCAHACASTSIFQAYASLDHR
jgi:hypothetical protein